MIDTLGPRARRVYTMLRDGLLIGQRRLYRPRLRRCGHHDRDLEVVAEGVQTPQIRDLLAGLGCDMAQSYGVSRPLPAEELTRWLQESHRAVAT